MNERCFDSDRAGPEPARQVHFDTANNSPVAQCFAGDDDLQALMVSAGRAWSFGRSSNRYAPEEREAVGRTWGAPFTAACRAR